MLFHEPSGLTEHTTGAATGVINLPVKGFDHFDQRADDTGRSIEFAAQLTLGRSELSKEVFIHATEHVLLLCGRRTNINVGEERHQFAQAGLIQFLAGIVLRQHALQRIVLLFDGLHRRIDYLADVRVGGVRLDDLPARFLRHPEDVVGQIFVPVFLVAVAFGLQGKKFSSL